MSAHLAASGYTPSDWQLKYHTTSPRIRWVLGAGSAGPGKSLCLLHEPVFQQIPIEHARCLRGDDGLPDPSGVAEPGGWLWKLIQENPLEWGDSTGHALFLMRDFKRMRETLRRAHKMLMRLDKGTHFNATDTVYTLSSGFQYQFGHCLEIRDWEKYDSNQYTFLLIDEATQFDEEQIDNIEIRLRSADPVLSKFLKARMMSNPQRSVEGSAKVRDPFWVRKRFVDPCREGNKVIRRKFKLPGGAIRYTSRLYLPATLDDNPDKDFVAQYKDSLASSNKPHIVRAMLEGDWYVVPGAFYADAWSVSRHICKPFNAPIAWKFFRSLDWGFKTHGCIHWWALDDEGTLYCIKELTFRGKTADVVARIIRDIEKRLGLWNNVKDVSKISGPADTQLWEQRGDRTKGKATEMLDEGVMWFKADKKSRRSNAGHLYARMVEHEEGESAVPGIVFFDTCRKAIATIPSIATDPDDLESPDDPKDDHWHDSALYACSYASQGANSIPRLPTSSDDDDHLLRHVKRQQRPVKSWAYGH